MHMISTTTEHQRYHLTAEGYLRDVARNAYKAAGYDRSTSMYQVGLHSDHQADLHHMAAVGMVKVHKCMGCFGG